MKKCKKAPIFVVGFNRGGTNILCNLLLSHKNIVAVRGEFLELFDGEHIKSKFVKYNRKIIKKIHHHLMGDIVLSGDLKKEPKPFPDIINWYIRNILYHEPLKAKEVSQNKFKTKDILYKENEIINSHPMCKLVNGNSFIVEHLSKMFPNCYFIFLIRNGYAICEGRKRRGEPVEKTAAQYQLICTQHKKNAEKIKNYKIIKFEDIISNFFEVSQDIFKFLKLDYSTIETFRFASKGVTTSNGYIQPSNKIIWYCKEEVLKYFVQDVNQNQIKNLSLNEVEIIKQIAGNSLKEFNYTY